MPANATVAQSSAPKPNPTARATPYWKPCVAAERAETTKDGPGLIAAARWMSTIAQNAASDTRELLVHVRRIDGLHPDDVIACVDVMGFASNAG